MEEWKTYKLGDLIKIKYGKDHKSLADGNYPAYGSGGVMRMVERPIYDKPSILIPRKGSLNNIIYTEKPFWTVDTMFWTIIDTKLVLPHYLYYTIKDVDFASLNVGSAVPSLTCPIIEAIEVSIPCIETQKMILNCIEPLDSKIELNNRINHNLEEQARNIFLSYIDCDSVECSFSDLITVGSGGTPRTSESRFWNGDIPFFSPKDVSNSCFTLFTEKLITKDGLNNCNSSLYNENTTFITARGTVGKISLAGVSMAMNQSCFALTSKDNTPYFAYFLTERVVESLKKKANGAVFDAINSKDILQELVRVPNRDVIFQIEDRIRPYMNSIRFKSIENLYLTDTRDTLLPKLMSGELKINNLIC